MEIQNIKEELKLRIATGLNFGIEALEEVLDKYSRLYNQFILLKSKYNDLMQYSSINVLPYNELELGFDKLRNSLLSLIDQMEVVDASKSNVEQEPENKALTHRRTNFFQLMDIHFQNLQAIVYREQVWDSTNSKYNVERLAGREAVFKIYDNLRYAFTRRFQEETAVEVRDYFKDFFLNERGMLEVYIKNIRHLLEYVVETEVDRKFFINTLKSILSRFELSLLFYYGLTNIDPVFSQLLRDTGFLSDVRRDTLMKPNHLDYF